MNNEFRAIEQYTGELEALRSYDQVKEDRDLLAAEAAQLREKLAKLETQLKAMTASKKKLATERSKNDADVRNFTAKLDEVQKELSTLKDFKAKLPDGSELPLEEMRTQFLEEVEEEVERRGNERFKKLKRDIKSYMPSLVHKKLVQILKRPPWPPDIEQIINAKAKEVADGLLRDMEAWPDWFRDYYCHQVEESVIRRLDSEFDKNVQLEAQKRLEELMSNHWQQYVTRKASELCGDLRNMVRQLQGSWWINCDRCGRRIAVEIGPTELVMMVKRENIKVTCITCTDPASFPFVFSTVPHQASSLTLEMLLEAYIRNPPPGN